MARTRNPNIKGSNVVHEYSYDQLLELKKCSNDPVYFIRKYVKIQHPTHGIIPFNLRPYQERMLHGYKNNRFTVVLAARQVGKSVVSGAYLLWYACFNADKTVLIASNKNSNAMEMIHRIRLGYEELPMWLKPGIKDDGWNKHSVGFDNGTRIISEATSINSGRGLSISLLYLDEFAHVAKSIQEEFWTSIEPTLSTGGSCIMTSTPNGDIDIFAQIWRGSQVQSNGFFPVEVKWNEPPGRDDKFKEDTVGRIGEQKWKQEYECVLGSSLVTIQDGNGNILTVTIEDLYKLLETHNNE